jgi:ArsR family transcriptional regulator, arsenate/arsenite/antimonite-responsive transcriptional repressor
MTSTTTDVCCPPLLAEPLDEPAAHELAAAFRALADPVRLRLLSLIAAAPDGTACSCDLEAPVGKSQPTVSHHLAVLADAGLITKEKVGRWVNCTVVPERLGALRDVLGSGGLGREGYDAVARVDPPACGRVV